MRNGFSLPPGTCNAIYDIEDGALGRVLEIMFRLQVRGQLTDMRNEEPIVKVGFALASSTMDAWARRAAQNREAQQRHRSSLTSAQCQHDVSMTSAKEGKEEAKEKVSPTPPYKEKEKEKDQERQPSVRVNADVSRPNANDLAIASWFASFWCAYPRKVAKRQAEQAWYALFRRTPVAGRRALYSRIATSLDRAKQTRDWCKEGGRFVPHPTTYIHQERWTEYDDEPAGRASAQNKEADDLAKRLLDDVERSYAV